MTLSDFNNRYSYKLDVMGRDLWFVIKPDMRLGCITVIARTTHYPSCIT